jgi:hypothetical protein
LSSVHSTICELTPRIGLLTGYYPPDGLYAFSPESSPVLEPQWTMPEPPPLPSLDGAGVFRDVFPPGPCGDMTYCALDLYVDTSQLALPWGSAPEENKMILSYHIYLPAGPQRAIADGAGELLAVRVAGAGSRIRLEATSRLCSRLWDNAPADHSRVLIFRHHLYYTVHAYHTIQYTHIPM